MRSNAGFTMIELFIVIAIIAIVAAIAVPLMNRNRIAANETSAEPPYISDSKVAAGERDGYTFEVVGATATGFQALASPVTFEKTGVRHFLIDESGVVRFTTDGSTPDEDSPAIE